MEAHSEPYNSTLVQILYSGQLGQDYNSAVDLEIKMAD